MDYTTGLTNIMATRQSVLAIYTGLVITDLYANFPVSIDLKHLQCRLPDYVTAELSAWCVGYNQQFSICSVHFLSAILNTRDVTNIKLIKHAATKKAASNISHF